MGNLLCIPREHRSSGPRPEKKGKKGSSAESRSSNGDRSIEKSGSLHVGDHASSEDQSKPIRDCSRIADIYVCPVVSSSILLRHHDEDDEIIKELPEEQNEHEPKEEETGSTNDSTEPTGTDGVVPLEDKVPSLETSVMSKSGEIAPEAEENAKCETPTTTARVTEVKEANDDTCSAQEDTKNEQISLIPESKELAPKAEPLAQEKQAQIAIDTAAEFEKTPDKTAVGHLPEKGLKGLSSELAPVASVRVIKVEEVRKSSEMFEEAIEKNVVTRKKIESNVVPENDTAMAKPEVSAERIGALHPEFEITANYYTEENGSQSQSTSRRKESPVTKPDALHNNTNQDVVLKGQAKAIPPIQNVNKIIVKAVNEPSVEVKPLLGKEINHGQGSSTQSLQKATGLKIVPEKKQIAGVADVEIPDKKVSIALKEAVSCPSVPMKKHCSSHIKEFGALLHVLSALKIPQQRSTSDTTTTPSTSKAHVFGPQSDSSDKCGVYKSKQGIENWIHQSNPGTSSPVGGVSNTAVAKTPTKKVSDFDIPKKARKPPPAPLVLKKPSPHLYSIPAIAKSDPHNKVNWTQLEAKGPQTEVLWTTKPTVFNVKLPPLPKRLLERKGSVEKLQESWVLPQVKQIETLKRECGRFPGLVVPTNLRHKYSVDINNVGYITEDDDGGTCDDTKGSEN